MNSKSVFFKILKKYSKDPNEREYAQLLHTLMFTFIGDIETVVIDAEKQGKRISLTPEPEDRLREEYSTDDIIVS